MTICMMSLHRASGQSNQNTSCACNVPAGHMHHAAPEWNHQEVKDCLRV